jgi:hypothetical protein
MRSATAHTVALPSVDYTPRDPADDVLHRIMRDHLQSFLADAAHLRAGEGLLRLVEEEFRAFVTCGSLAGGFARFRSTACTAERLVAFSCKGRGFCPSRGGRRMTERACRYALRPPVAGERLQPTPDGQVVLQLRHAWADGTTHVGFTPTAFLERLALLVPRSHVNLLLYHGVLAPRAAWRAEWCRVPRRRPRLTLTSMSWTTPPQAALYCAV